MVLWPKIGAMPTHLNRAMISPFTTLVVVTIKKINCFGAFTIWSCSNSIRVPHELWSGLKEMALYPISSKALLSS